MKKFVTLFIVLFSKLYATNLLDLTLEDLTQITVTNTSASLTETSNKEIPATATIITQKEIQESGARNLDELLEIYVPSFNYMYKVYGTQMGMRGIMSDRNNKILLLVNNRVMNIRTSDGGAVTERWFSTLGDIKKITVITGPGSPIYGSGAIAGVISIETFDGSAQRGVVVHAKAGSGDQFETAEISYSARTQEGAKLYFYYGVDSDNGEDPSSAPMKFAFDYYSQNRKLQAAADQPYPQDVPNNNAALNQQLRHKLHLQYTTEDLLLWARFTRSSQENPTEQKLFQYISASNTFDFEHTGTLNQQLTLFAAYKHALQPNLLLEYDLSYQRSSLYTRYSGEFISLGIKAWREENFLAKISANYRYDSKNIFAFGSEYNYNLLGRNSDIGFTDYSYISSALQKQAWDTQILSFFGEYQKHFTPRLTMFAGTRADKHTYSEWIYSPRVSFIYNINNEDIFKANYNRSNRYSDESDLYLDYQRFNTNDDVETIDTYELIYTKYLPHMTMSLSTFYNDHQIIAFNSSLNETTKLGRLQSYGGEFEFNYHNDKMSFNFAHSYTKLYDFTLADPQTTIQNISAMPYGYGDDFANWNENITKIRLNYRVAKNLQWINSLRIFWGLEGGEDMANYNRSLDIALSEHYKLPYYDDGHTTAFEESLYFNTSLLWKVSKQTTVGLYGYNLLGLLNKDYNKRNFYFYTSQYRDVAPAIAFGIEYKLK